MPRGLAFRLVGLLLVLLAVADAPVAHAVLGGARVGPGRSLASRPSALPSSRPSARPSAPPSSRPSVQRRPNVVIYIADDLGVGEVLQDSALGFDGPAVPGATAIATPNLRRLAARGARLVRSYTSAPLCGPARFALMTGRPDALGVNRGNNLLGPAVDMTIPEGTATLPRSFRALCYATYAIGKWGLGAQVAAAGWDRFYGFLTHNEAMRNYPLRLWRSRGPTLSEEDLSAYNTNASANICQCKLGVTCLLDRDTGVRQNSPRCKYAGQLFRREAMQVLEEHVALDAARPFFLYWASIAPHAGVFNPSSPLTDKFFTSPVSTLGAYGRLLRRGGAWTAAVAGHMAQVTYEVDGDVGALLDKLDNLGASNDTVVLFLSDNGPHQEAGTPATYDPALFSANMGLRGWKREVYEGGLRSPTILSWPGPGRVPHGVALTVRNVGYDFALTLLSLAGAAPDALAPYQGLGAESIHTELLGGTGGPAAARSWLNMEICFPSWDMTSENQGCNYAFFNFSGAPGAGGRQLKLVRQSYRYELYDLGNDPHERVDLAAAEPAAVQDCVTRMRRAIPRQPLCPLVTKECATTRPSKAPTRRPSKRPTSQPATRAPVTMRPTTRPTTATPSARPTTAPLSTTRPSQAPTEQLSEHPTNNPTAQPSHSPTNQPTNIPTQEPTLSPENEPTARPSQAPIDRPSRRPSQTPTSRPSDVASDVPTEEPSTRPSQAPTKQPTKIPTSSPALSPTLA